MVDDGYVAAAGVIGAVSSDSANLVTLRRLIEQLWRHEAVTIAAGQRPSARTG
jgi:hypothetical protein